MFKELEKLGFKPHNYVFKGNVCQYIPCKRPRGGNISSMGYLDEWWFRESPEIFSQKEHKYICFGLCEFGYPPTFHSFHMKLKQEDFIINGINISHELRTRILENYSPKEFFDIFLNDKYFVI